MSDFRGVYGTEPEHTKDEGKGCIVLFGSFEVLVLIWPQLFSKSACFSSDNCILRTNYSAHLILNASDIPNGQQQNKNLSFSVLALDLHVVVGDLHVQIIGSKMLDVQVDCELFPFRPHL